MSRVGVMHLLYYSNNTANLRLVKESKYCAHKTKLNDHGYRLDILQQASISLFICTRYTVTYNLPKYKISYRYEVDDLTYILKRKPYRFVIYFEEGWFSFAITIKGKTYNMDYPYEKWDQNLVMNCEDIITICDFIVKKIQIAYI